MANKGMSTGCIIAAVVGGFFAVSALILVVIFGAGLFFYQRQGVPTVNSTPVTAPSSSPSSSPSSGGSAPKAEPTAEQASAIAGGKTVTWSAQDMSWTIPANWSVESEDDTYSAKSPGGWDAGWLIVSVSPMPGSFPADVSIQAMYDSAVEQKKMGQYESARWLEIDGIKGVEFLEANPSDPSDFRRLQWQGYRTHNGQTQLVNIMMKSTGKGFPEQSAALHGILYSSEVSN